jgi:hypothetical protein
MRLGIAFGPPVCASAEEIGIPAKLLNRCERDRIDPVLDCDDTSGPELGDRMSERPNEITELLRRQVQIGIGQGTSLFHNLRSAKFGVQQRGQSDRAISHGFAAFGLICCVKVPRGWRFNPVCEPAPGASARQICPSHGASPLWYGAARRQCCAGARP